MNTAAEFWNNINKRDDGCWIWLGRVRSNGYGYVFWKGRISYAHRVAYELSTGCAPPARTTATDSAVVIHSCDHPMCVRPEHLRLGTQAENMADRSERKRHWTPRGSAATNSKLNETSVAEIRRRLALGESQRTLAKAYGVSQPCIQSINAGKTWNTDKVC